MREMKDSGVEWIGEIPQNHSLLRNKYLFDYVKGKIPNSTNTDQIGYPYIGASDLDTFEEYNTFTTDEEIPSCRYDDLLVLWDGARAGLCGTHKVGGISSTIVRLRAKASYPSFLYWYYKGFENFMYQLVNGTTIPHMNRRYIEQIGWIDWSLREQEKITTYLEAKCSKIDAIITREQAVIEKLKEYKLSVITEAVTKGLNPKAPMKDSGSVWIGKVPEHWEITKLRSHTRMLTPMRDRPEHLDGDIPWIRIEDYDGKYISKSKEGLAVSKETVKAMNLKVYPIGSILCTSSCDLGKCAIVARELVSNQRFIDIIPDATCNSEFLYYLMLSNAKRLNHLSTGTIQANLSRVEFEHLLVQFPPYKEQCEIHAYLDEKCNSLDIAIEKKQSLITKLTEYKKSLIYEVVTGKKEV